MDMSFECLALVANLCVHSAVSIDFNDGGLMSTALIHERSAEIWLLLRSDNIVTPDWSKMNEACKDDVCVAYYKFCAPDEKGMPSCTYWFSQPGDRVNKEVTIQAKTDEQVREAEQDLGVVTRYGWIVKEIPFTSFKLVGQSSGPPYCNRHAPQSACWPASK